MIWYTRLNQFLNRRRLTYAWITGGVLWVAWIASLVFGPGSIDLAGQVVGTDYLQFYSSGLTLRLGQSANLYNFAYQAQLERTIAGPGLTSFHAFITPPFLAWLFVPFSFLPYELSFFLWSLLGLVLLWLSIKILGVVKPLNKFLWSLTWFPIFAAISFGQNSLLSVFIFSLSYWFMRKEKPLSAGLVSSLLLFKPQMVLGIGIFWLLEYRKSWKSLLGLLLGGIILVGLSFWILPDASRAYVDLSRHFLPQLIYRAEFPLWHLHSLRGFWIMLFPGYKLVAEVLSTLLSITGIIVYIFFWRMKRNQLDLIFAAAIILTLWISPHAMIYDWSILLIPALLFWNALPRFQEIWKPTYSLMWLGTFISGPLSYMMLKYFHFAIQLTIPILGFVIFTTYKILLGKTTPKENDIVLSSLS